LVIVIASGELLLDRELSELEGYGEVAGLFKGYTENKGLEGIAIDPVSGHVYLLKEAKPRLMLELSPDLGRILGHRILNDSAGFYGGLDPDGGLAVSGIVRDPVRGLSWIVSDRGARVFLLPDGAHPAVHLPLTEIRNGEVRAVKNAEGIALDRTGQRLFVISDDGKSSRLFTYRIEEPAGG